MSVKTKLNHFFVATVKKWISLILIYMIGLYPKLTQVEGIFLQILRCHGNGQILFGANLAIF